MNEKVLNTLEYIKIRDRLTEKCLTPLGKEEAMALVPGDDPEAVQAAQEETRDALSRVLRYGVLSCSGARDIRDSLIRLRVQASLGIPELMNISVLLAAAARVRAYGTRGEEPDVLTEQFLSIEPLITLKRELDRCILSEDEIADDASPALKSIRRKIAAAEARVRSELNQLLITQSPYLRENVITQRNGRYCIPVRNEYRTQVQGMIHDESGSGNTVFIEPLSVIRLNNEIRQLEIDEEKEIAVILAKLSAQAGDHQEELSRDLKLLSHLDFVFAKAVLARDMDATMPVFNRDRRIVLKKARHPLLDRKSVVPIDVTLGDGFDQLIVTGPNTGGKTVSLKTVGLLSLMGQAGLHIPCFEGSSLGFFREVYADIGDEQSIEQSLSTFSSHMRNIIGILDKADGDSLVLLDELCAGTDPQEGAALAISILTFLHRMQVRTMATTHYSELKLYALSTPGVENASCEFDVATLSPTYRLLIGIPGKSNAFAISKKLGLPGFIIDEARGQIDADAERFEDVIKNLDDSRHEMEREREQINVLRAEARRLKDSLAKQEERLAAQKEAILREAREEARKLLSDAKAQVDQAIREINKSGSYDVRALEKARTETREMLDRFTDAKKTEKARGAGMDPAKLKIGDAVRVLSLGLTGTVSTLPDPKGNLFVQMGILRSQVHISDLEPIEEATVRLEGKELKKSGNSSIGLSKASTISPELNLIGKTVDDALAELEKYLDDAYLSHLEEVRIVHGRGTGALRSAVHAYLRRVKTVKEFRLGAYGEGDSGVTIVKFK